jgi:hypothetical protein
LLGIGDNLVPFSRGPPAVEEQISKQVGPMELVAIGLSRVANEPHKKTQFEPDIAYIGSGL